MRIDLPYGRDYKSKSRDIKIRYFIACEGCKTEYLYIDGIINNAMQLNINSLIQIIPIIHEEDETGSNPLKNILPAAEKEFKKFKMSIDRLCIIVDRDMQSFKLDQFEELVSICNRKRYQLYISNPAFELWLLFHHSDISEYNIEDIQKNKKEGHRTFLEKCLIEKQGEYKKNNIKFQEQYLDRIDIAIENSKKYCTDVNLLKNKVGTNFGMLIKELRQK